MVRNGHEWPRVMFQRSGACTLHTGISVWFLVLQGPLSTVGRRSVFFLPPRETVDSFPEVDPDCLEEEWR